MRTYQGEQTAFWIGRKLGAPYLNRRYIHLFFNGQQRSTLYEDSQQPNANVVGQFFPDDTDGSLHKIEDWFEFNDTGDNMLGNIDATLQDFTTTGGVKKTARYRWNWRPRATREIGQRVHQSLRPRGQHERPSARAVSLLGGGPGGC